jgi:N,N'-diacetyllegionaminate synthase
MGIRQLLSGEQKGVYIIAEVGVNHNGSVELAKRCIDKAAWAGADAVKFQTFRSEKLVTRNALKAEYQVQNTKTTESQLDMLRKLELKFEDFVELQSYCQDKQVDFLSTPFDEESADFLNQIHMDAFKIGSGDANNLPFLRRIDNYGKPVILSTGMSSLEEVQESVAVFHKSQLALLHCTSDYPAPLDEVNLLAMKTLMDNFGLCTGYSDHTKGVEIPLAAVALGGTIIEKHFTLDNNLLGPDHRASLEPQQFAEMVRAIRNVEQALGDGIKRCMPSEQKTKTAARKSIVLAAYGKTGTILEERDLVIKRPGTGIEPKYFYEVVGRKLNKDLQADELLSWSDLE